MQKLLYAIILFLIVSEAKAQENRGTLIPAKIIQRSIMVGGNLSGAYKRISNSTSNATEKGDRLRFDLDAKVGYFVFHDLALGVRGTISHARESMSGQISTRTTNILVGPFTRYYLDNGIFGEASAAVGVNNRPNRAKTDLAEFRGGVGYTIFINPKVAVEPALMFCYYQEKRPAESNAKFTELGPAINLGLQVYLFRERKFKIVQP
ncbi:hypothetical protein EFA69_17250 [Rufibacter immobilis]|uniref:Outer membrane protein beta-barrel domain-containing protein n=1 Tax=Rufibacter immobilis TaxID=1348778 RepID=A0A3M9MRL4_9BACT|nr:hypothetical protein [Rufibacter immobilis]RNI27845.1 hypothetical protein EFA69_17250 [Rufibacter immobilis]